MPGTEPHLGPRSGAAVREMEIGEENAAIHTLSSPAHTNPYPPLVLVAGSESSSIHLFSFLFHKTVVSSSNGVCLVAVTTSGEVWVSTDSGLTYVNQLGAPADQLWYAVASSSDFSKLVAVANGGQLYTSTDFGKRALGGDLRRAACGPEYNVLHASFLLAYRCHVVQCQLAGWRERQGLEQRGYQRRWPSRLGRGL